ncbi:ABC transporter permease [Pontibacter burrus]|uniref:FtsX-like permease family protein n=1 Tax=Pontibacter burrus TaxID=2704466 RepID=A0A6B3LYG3_9BACT|nr:ABC transporter permease [Pontibacter burrus]NEM98710.1 FtsX-like permease family protein [Pontibacter burrus]
MLKNYFKIAWKVLLRRKFFTFISLFGISVTLMVLMVITAMLNQVFGTHTPEKKMDRMLFVTWLHMTGDGTEMNSGPSYSFLNRFVRPLNTPELITIYSSNFTTFNFTQGSKLNMQTRYTDSNFWRVMDFEFIDGGGFGDAAVETAQKVAVINEATSIKNFGTVDAVGKTLTLDDSNYRVVGVVKNVAATRTESYSEVWVPYTTTKADLNDPHYGGNFRAVLLAKDKAAIDDVKKEFYGAMAKVPMMPGEDFTVLKVFADTNTEGFAREISRSVDNEVNTALLYGVVIGGMFFFMLIPTLNLVNINISRIMERASEIGVRKAFGASSNTLVLQFLFENIFLTIIGGTIGILLAVGALHLINNSGFIPYAQLGLNVPVLLFSLLICLFFGILSGVYPAYKMSKLHPASVLKGGSK